jgi:hypothetical protein
MYTTHGYMTADDYQEYLKDTDNGSTEIQLDDVPRWAAHLPVQPCPVCGAAVYTHESVTVLDASGEIYACVDAAGEVHR